MRTRLLFSLFLIAAAAAPAGANMGGSPPPEPRPAPAPQMDAGATGTLTPRQQAEQLYGGAYDDVAKATKDLADGKQKNAQKKLKRALDRASEAVKIDSTYFEAWNLVGFSSRKLGDYPTSFAAYGRCLAIKPDYVPAREYLGEALIEQGKIREAREQLAWLERLNAPDQAKALGARIGEWQTAHPEAAGAGARPDSAAPAPAARPDSAAKAPPVGSGQ